MTSLIKVWLVLGVLGCWGVAQAAAPADSGAPAAVTKLCMNCHNADGNSDSPMIPRLAGQQADYIERQLQAYREQSRTNPAARNYMWGMAHMLSDQEIKQVAAWFAGQKPTVPVAAPADDRTRLGEQVFRNGMPDKGIPACAVCHGSHGEGGPIAPRIAGQHDHYLATQLKVMSTDERPAATAMQGFAKQLTQADIEGLAAYLSHLP